MRLLIHCIIGNYATQTINNIGSEKQNIKIKQNTFKQSTFNEIDMSNKKMLNVLENINSNFSYGIHTIYVHLYHSPIQEVLKKKNSRQ